MPDALTCVAQLEIDTHRFARAAELLREALGLAVGLGDQRIIARCLERLAYLAAGQGRYQRALMLEGTAETLRRASVFPRAPVEIRMLRSWLAPAKHSLEPSLRDQVRRRTASMTREQTIAYALDMAGAT